MPEQIRDGTGTGKLLKVNDCNRMMCSSIVQSEESEINEREALAFIVSTKVLTLNSTNPHLFLYIKNTNTDKNMYLWIANFAWNGGSINHNRTMKLSWVITPNEPTANHTAVIPSNLNFISNNTAESLIYKWDGVGDGMTYTGGILISEEIFAQGHSRLEVQGIPIVGLNDSVGFLIAGEEIGDAVITVRFFYK